MQLQGQGDSVAGIQGQPTASPQDLPKTPGDQAAQDPYADLALPEANTQGDSYQAGAGQAQADNQPLVDPNSTAGEYLQTFANAAPTVGGIAGGLTGGMWNMGVGSGPGAVIGAVGGNSVKRLIEINLLGKDPNATVGQEIGDSALTAGRAALENYIGGKIFKGAGNLAAGAYEKFGKAPMEAMAASVKSTIDGIEKPAYDFINTMASKLNSREAGDFVKSLLNTDISTKYAKYAEQYKIIGDIASQVPLAVDKLKSFIGTQGFHADNQLIGDGKKAVQPFIKQLGTATNVTQLKTLMGDVKSAMAVAWDAAGRQSTTKYEALKHLSGEIGQFLDDHTIDFAKKIQDGGMIGTGEKQFLERILQMKGEIEPDAGKYARALANDFLKTQEKLSADYGGFREFLKNVGEQTKKKIGRMGPTKFLNDLEAMPSETLVKNMFQPENSRALEKMAEQNPTIFEQIRASKLRQIVQDTSEGPNLNLKGIRDYLKGSKFDSTRHLILDNAQWDELNAIVDNKVIPAQQKLLEEGQKTMAKWAAKMAYVEHVNKMIPQSVKATSKYATGKAVTATAGGIASLFGSGDQGQ
jgi:hypothetical protein